MPTIGEPLDFLGRAKCYTQLDLTDAYLLTGRRIFQLYRVQFSNTGITGGLYIRLTQLSWHLQKLPIHSSRRFQHDLTVARPCYVTETEYFPRFHEIPCVSISWIDAFPWSSNNTMGRRLVKATNWRQPSGPVMVAWVSDHGLPHVLTTFPAYINNSLAEKLDRLNRRSYTEGPGQPHEGLLFLSRGRPILRTSLSPNHY